MDSEMIVLDLNENMDKLVFIAEYLICHEIMDEDQFKHVMETDAPTVEELESIAAEKAEKSILQSLEMISSIPERSRVGDIPFSSSVAGR